MKKTLSFLLVLLMLLCCTALADTAQVADEASLIAALEDDGISAVEVTGDMTVTCSDGLYLTKDVTILADVIFRPAPDDGFFIKSIVIPEDVTLTVKGSLITEHTFDNGFAIAQVEVAGGTLDASEGIVSNRISFVGGTLIGPEGGFAPEVEIGASLSGSASEQALLDLLEDPYLWLISIDASFSVSGQITIPERKDVMLCTVITVEDGGALNGAVTVDPGCGVILKGSGSMNGLTVPDGMAACMIIWAEDGTCATVEYSETPVPVTVAQWLEKQGVCGNCMLTVTVTDLLNPMLGVVTDGTGTVNLYGIQAEDSFLALTEAGISAGDTITILNPRYNVYDGSVEMSDAILMK